MRKSVRNSAKATVTRLAPGAFSPRPTPYRTFIASYYFFILELLVLKINVTNAVPDPAPSLLDSNFIEPANLQLLF
jgi:hypothetical protein